MHWQLSTAISRRILVVQKFVYQIRILLEKLSKISFVSLFLYFDIHFFKSFDGRFLDEYSSYEIFDGIFELRWKHRIQISFVRQFSRIAEEFRIQIWISVEKLLRIQVVSTFWRKIRNNPNFGHTCALHCDFNCSRYKNCAVIFSRSVFDGQHDTLVYLTLRPKTTPCNRIIYPKNLKKKFLYT